MTFKQKINILAKALRYYKQNGTRTVLVDSKGQLLVENGIIADEALAKAGVTKRTTKQKLYLRDMK